VPAIGRHDVLAADVAGAFIPAQEANRDCSSGTTATSARFRLNAVTIRTLEQAKPRNLGRRMILPLTRLGLKLVCGLDE